MPHDDHLPMPRRNPEDINLGRIQSDLEFLVERVSGLPRDRGDTGDDEGQPFRPADDAWLAALWQL